MTIYLIDFENVSIGGLKGAAELGQQDLVFLFSSKNAARLTTATLATFNSTTLKFVEVPVKKQSLDMHLVSYLGYLIGTTDAEHFIIISNDHDYDNIMAFWRANGRNVIIERRGSISAEAAAQKTVSSTRTRRGRNTSRTNDERKAEQPVNIPEENKPTAEAKDNTRNKKRGPVKTEEPAKADTAAAPTDKTAAIKEALSKVYDEKVCNDVLSIISSHSEEHNPLTSIHNDLRDTYKDPDYLDIYKLIKPILSESSASSGRRRRQGKNPSSETAPLTETNTVTENTADNTKAAPGKNRGRKHTPKSQPNSDVTRINNEVQKILSKAKFETEIISFVAGLAAKSHGVKNGKMSLYRGIISKYGREKGLEIYDHLKTLLSDPDLWK